MEYRTKAAMKIIAGLKKNEAFELFNLVRTIEDKFKGNEAFLFQSLQSLDRKTAIELVIDTVNEWENNGELEVPSYLKYSFKSFLELMMNERAQLDEILFEYNCALCPLLQYDLFKLDT